MPERWTVVCYQVLVVALLGTSNHAQGATIPESLRAAGRSPASGASIPSGPPPTIDSILADADAIVRGVVSTGRSYLSADQKDVLTDYEFVNPVFLYSTHWPTAPDPRPLPVETVTLLGGSVTIGALTFTSTHEALPALELGQECLLLLKKTGDHRYRVAGTYYGAFEIRGGQILVLTKKFGFASEYQDQPVDDVSQDLVARKIWQRR